MPLKEDRAGPAGRRIRGRGIGIAGPGCGGAGSCGAAAEDQEDTRGGERSVRPNGQAGPHRQTSRIRIDARR
jgi:hypothetical protein